jgi:hypothetical protein
MRRASSRVSRLSIAGLCCSSQGLAREGPCTPLEVGVSARDVDLTAVDRRGSSKGPADRLGQGDLMAPTPDGRAIEARPSDARPPWAAYAIDHVSVRTQRRGRPDVDLQYHLYEGN